MRSWGIKASTPGDGNSEEEEYEASIIYIIASRRRDSTSLGWGMGM